MDFASLLSGAVGGFCAGQHQPGFVVTSVLLLLTGLVVLLVGAFCCLLGFGLGCACARCEPKTLRQLVGPAAALGSGGGGAAVSQWAVQRMLEYRRD